MIVICEEMAGPKSVLSFERQTTFRLLDSYPMISEDKSVIIFSQSLKERKKVSCCRMLSSTVEVH